MEEICAEKKENTTNVKMAEGMDTTNMAADVSKTMEVVLMAVMAKKAMNTNGSNHAAAKKTIVNIVTTSMNIALKDNRLTVYYQAAKCRPYIFISKVSENL